jgi:hypothetical protein
MPALGGNGFELRLLPIDLKCNAYAAYAQFNIPPMLARDRLSIPPSKCVDGVFGSWTTEISARRIEVDSPQTCVLQDKPPGYKVTSRYTPHVYYRNP